jgi:hypothetical protein
VEPLSTIWGAASGKFLESLAQAKEDKKTYTEKLETAQGDAIFKYVLLINVSALEGYVAQTRIQAEQSFRISIVVSVIGFAMLIAAIILGIVSTVFGVGHGLDAAYISAAAGTLTEFISGVFFYLYNRTLQQINLFHDKLAGMEQLSMEYLARSIDLTPDSVMPPK